MATITNTVKPTSRGRGRGPSAEGVRAWIDLMAACEELQLAGLLRKVGPDGDLKAEFRRRRVRVREERDRGVARVLEGLSQARG